MTYTPEQIEWAGQFAASFLPVDHICHKNPRGRRDTALKVLAELSRQGVKVTQRRQFDLRWNAGVWTEMHDAAPICPDAGKGE